MAADLTLCANDAQFPAEKCLSRNCTECNTDGRKDFLKEKIANHGDKKLTWYKWQYITMEDECDNNKRITSCVQQESTFAEFIPEFQDDLQNYPSHAFRAKWQHQQMQSCISNMGPGQVLMVIDYENYKCCFQSEAQNANFDQQVTIHLMMLYYHEQVNEWTLLVKHSIIGISDDKKHDSHGVKVFESKADGMLEGIRRCKHQILASVHWWLFSTV